jgi:hypothetical protein
MNQVIPASLWKQYVQTTQIMTGARRHTVKPGLVLFVIAALPGNRQSNHGYI